MKIQPHKSQVPGVVTNSQSASQIELMSPDALFEEFSKTLDKVVTKLGETVYASEVPQDSALVSRQIEHKETKKVAIIAKDKEDQPKEPVKNVAKDDKPADSDSQAKTDSKSAKTSDNSEEIKNKDTVEEDNSSEASPEKSEAETTVNDESDQAVIESSKDALYAQQSEPVENSEVSDLDLAENAAKVAAMLLEQKGEIKEAVEPKELKVATDKEDVDEQLTTDDQSPLMLGEQNAETPVEQSVKPDVASDLELKKPEQKGDKEQLALSKPLESVEAPLEEAISPENVAPEVSAPETPVGDQQVPTQAAQVSRPQTEANQSYEAKMFEVAMRAMMATQEALELAQTSDNLRQRSEISQLIQALPKGLTGLDRSAKVTQATSAQPLQFSDLGTSKQAQNSQGGESGKTRSLPKPAEARTLEKVEGALKEVAKSKDGRTISVRLDPPDLGTVKVDVTLKNDTLHARIVAEAPQVGQFLRERSHELVGMLRKLGIEAEKVSVSVGHNGQENGAAAFEQFAENHSHKGEQQKGQKRFAPSTADVVAAEQRVKLSDDHWVA